MRFNIKPLFSTAGRTICKHAPTLLTGMAVGAAISASVETAKSTVKAVNDIQEAEKEKGEKLSKKEIVKVTWKHYVTPVIMLGISATCCVSSHRLHVRRGAMLAAEYASAVTALDNYKAKAKEVLGEEKVEEITKEIAKEEVKDNPPVNDINVFDANGGDTLFFDYASGRYFRSDKQTIREVINNLNARLMTEMFISVNDFYYDLGMPPLGIEHNGWHVEKGLITPEITTFEAPGDTPCSFLDFLVRPSYEFYC